MENACVRGNTQDGASVELKTTYRSPPMIVMIVMQAHAMMMAAAAPDDVSPVDILLAGSQGSPKTLSA